MRRIRAYGFAIGGAAVLGAVVWGGHALYRATRALDEARRQTANEEEIRFTRARLAAPPSRFEPIASPAVFRGAAVYRGALYVSGPGGVIEFGEDGAPRARHLAGGELPAAPTAIAAGVAADAGEPELLIATAGEGLVAYNGRWFRQVRPVAADWRDLTAVLPLETGRVLLGTEKKGVLVYDGKRITAFHPGLANLHVTALAGDEASLWAGTVNEGVLHWRGGAVERFSEEQGLPDARVLSIAVQGEAAYIGTPDGIAEFSSGRFVRALGRGLFAQSLLAGNGTLVVGTLEQGVVEIPLEAARRRPGERRGEPLEGAVYALMESGGVRYAVAGDGVYRRRTGWERVLEAGAAPLTDRNISALAFDGAGRLWVGYFDRGLDILDAGLARATHVEDDHVFCVNRIVHDPARGISAVATANGLVLFDAAGRPRQALGRADGLIANHVTDVVLRPGGMTVATPAGLTFLDGGGVRSLYAFHGLVNNHAYALAEAGGRLMVGTLGGLSVLEGDVVKANYTAANSGLKHNWITAIVPVEDQWFVGTYGAGVLRLDAGGAFHGFADLAPSVIDPNAMLVTEAAVYAGSLSDGLFLYDRASGRWRNLKAGLPSANVTAFAAHGGYVYAGTDNGLVRFRENSL
jgi:ligand-binding sensor domain-containing protein